MSSQSTQNQYQVAIVGNYGNALGVFTDTGDGWSDIFAAQLAAAFEAVQWPEGTTAAVVKQAIVTQQFTTDLATTPPTFT